MSADLEMQLRTASSYKSAHLAVDTLRDFQVWPTPLNYELCLHYLSDPEGPLAQAVNRLIAEGTFHSDDFSAKLAQDFLPRFRFQDQLSDAGEVLELELTRVSTVLDEARDTNRTVSEALGALDLNLAKASSIDAARDHIAAASSAVRSANARADEYHARFAESAAEVQHLREQVESIRRQTLTDPLTQLANRRAFDQEIARACTSSNAAGEDLTLAIVDIDYFKRFNDTWGHQTGDQVIRYIAGVLRAAAPAPRMAARYGGEEFALVLPGDRHEAAVRMLENVRKEIARRELKRRATGEQLGTVSISVGVAYHQRGETSSALIERADAALYDSKRLGRNRVTLAGTDSGLPSKRTAGG